MANYISKICLADSESVRTEFIIKDLESREAIESLQEALENYIATTAKLVGGTA